MRAVAKSVRSNASEIVRGSVTDGSEFKRVSSGRSESVEVVREGFQSDDNSD